MAETNTNRDECSSPDMFEGMEDPEMHISESMDFDTSFSIPQSDENKPEEEKELELDKETPDLQSWKGMSIKDILGSSNRFDFQELPPIRPSESHAVLFQLPLPDEGTPKPYPSNPVDKWAPGFVRMPNSPQSLLSSEEVDKDKEREIRSRWEVIQEALLQTFVSSIQLEVAIMSYNPKFTDSWNFNALHYFFEELIEEEQTEIFFKELLPKMIQLALQLPTLITGAIPLLKQHCNNSISLSQLQVASLLANAFFCTFPRRNSFNPNSEYASYPKINFSRLFGALSSRRECVAEKFKCLFHYFRRVTTSAPEGTITIQRRYIAPNDCPKWDQIHQNLNGLHITNEGTIELEGAGLLQVDFANKFLGGGVLRFGCVQEEIRFVICPELMVSMLVAEVMDDTEALVISGIERYSDYEGYSNSFKWSGDFKDDTPRDSSGRRKTTVVAIDAMHFTRANKQFNTDCIVRELNKAYVGFHSPDVPSTSLPPVATGNWGCGAFNGDPRLKALIQIMAATAAKRSVVYFTFGDRKLRDTLAEMYWHLVGKNIDIARLFSMLKDYKPDKSNFYKFLYTYNEVKTKPITTYFKVINEKEAASSQASKSPSTSSSAGNKTISDNSRYTPLPITIHCKADKKNEVEDGVMEGIEEQLANSLSDNLKTDAVLEESREKRRSRTPVDDNKWLSTREKPKNMPELEEIEVDRRKTKSNERVDLGKNENKHITSKKKLSLWDVMEQQENPTDRLLPIVDKSSNIFDSPAPRELSIGTDNIKNTPTNKKTPTSSSSKQSTPKSTTERGCQRKISDFYVKKT